ncbi:MAG: hypothetical protein IT580_05295 [Verrucomicrobiales bacterium]|nr:hypothetical protein [Verrucomicrobiales bacterium]
MAATRMLGWMALGTIGVLALGIALHHATRPAPFPPPLVVTVGQSNGPIRVFPGIGGMVMLAPDGTLWRWGMAGQRSRALVPTPVGSESNWVQAVCGNNHLLALRGDGTLWQMGYLGPGQLPSSTLKQVGKETNWATVAVSDVTTAALQADGTLHTWGESMGFGTLGDPTVSSRAAPAPVGSGRWTALDLTGYNAGHCGLTTNGTLMAWGLALQPGSTLPEPTPIAPGTGWITASLLAPLDAHGVLWTFPGSWPTPSATSALVRLAEGMAPGRYAVGHRELRTIAPDGALEVRRINRDRHSGVSVSAPQRLDIGVRWIGLSSSLANQVGVTEDGTVWVWGVDWSEEPTLTPVSQFKRALHTGLNLFGETFGFGRLSHGLSTSATHRSYDDARPLVRFVIASDSDPPTAPAPPTPPPRP